MTTVFEVDTIFRIINRASPVLTAILRQVRELNSLIDKTKANLATLGQGTAATASLTGAIGETRALAAAWGDVAKNAATARGAITGMSTRALPAAGAAVAAGGAAAAGGGGGGTRLGHRRGFFAGGGGPHFYGPGVAIPGGAHVSMTGPAMAGAALLGWGVIEAGEMQDAYASFLYHTGEADTPSNAAFFRNVVQKAMVEGGVTKVHDVTEAATDVVRQMKGTDTGGIDIINEVMRAARTEQLLKGGGGLKDATDAMLGLAHMTKEYDPASIKKLFPAFAFMSVANPDSLTRMQTAASYAVPLLQSGMGMDPLDALLLGTALRRAGAANSKSGTWLARAMEGAMPGTTPISQFRFNKHASALRDLGLVDDQGKPTWFTDGKPDAFKMFETVNAHLDKMPVAERMGALHQAFGEQGSRGVALLGDPAVRDQIRRLKAERDSPEFKNRYSNFLETYYERSPVQQARVALAEFNVTMMDLGTMVLPAVSGTLKDFKKWLELIRGLIPAPPGGTDEDKAKKAADVGTKTLEGAALGALVGAAVGPVGWLGGALIGGGLGAASAFTPTPTDARDALADSVAAFWKKANESTTKLDETTQKYIQDLKNNGGVFPGGTTRAPVQTPPIHFSLNVDGQTLAQTVIDKMSQMTTFPTGAPSPDGAGRHFSGDHNYADQ